MVNISPIVAIKRSSMHKHIKRTILPLTNYELFRRDAQLCMYCWHQFHAYDLTRDHVITTIAWRERPVVKHCNSLQALQHA